MIALHNARHVHEYKVGLKLVGGEHAILNPPFVMIVLTNGVVFQVATKIISSEVIKKNI